MFRLPRRYAEEIIAHARDEAPNECCGIILGTDGRVERLYRARNVEQSPVKYSVDPADLYGAYTEAEDKGWEFLAFYHSHTRSEAYPSPTDVRLAAWPDSLYILVSLQDPENPVIRAFYMVDGKITEEELVIEDS
ncbi:MAG: Mov34/MPN/PAD-1 family protein [Dehalococcoidia bacterium]